MINKWNKAPMLEPGNAYLLVSDKGALAGNDSDGLRWIDVETDLETGSLPDEAAVWSYDGKLCNGSGKFLKSKITGTFWNTTGYFCMDEIGEKIYCTNGRLYTVVDFLGARKYFSGIEAGYGIVGIKEHEAVELTIYELEVTPIDDDHEVFDDGLEPMDASELEDDDQAGAEEAAEGTIEDADKDGDEEVTPSFDKMFTKKQDGKQAATGKNLIYLTAGTVALGALAFNMAWKKYRK